MLTPLLILWGLLWMAALAGCDAEAPTDSPPVETPPSPTATLPAEDPAPPPGATPSPAATARPAATAAPTPTAATTPQLTTEFITPPERDYYRLARELIPGVGDVDPVVRHTAPTLEVGHRETFRLVDLIANRQYEREFELRLVTPNAYWFVEEGIEVDQQALEQSANEFEDSIRPRVVGVFGEEWTPGVDGDPHLYVINANLRGAGGYFNSADEYPKAIRPVSNEIEAIYINIRVPAPRHRHLLAGSGPRTPARRPLARRRIGGNLGKRGPVGTGRNHSRIPGNQRTGIPQGRADVADSLAPGRPGRRQELRLRLAVHAVLHRALRRAR